jgi:DNA polymerase III subunit gamma/tau
LSYQALYRSWRPQTFADLVGQPHVRQTLTNAISHGQVAHAYLFCGPRGTGKTSTAKVFAKAVNCLYRNGVEPCNECENCLAITAGNHVDVEEIDAASNRGVDEIRQLREKVLYAPASLKKKVYIVDEVHMLTTEAFNALLKTLEEPPAHALFILATTEPHKIPGTIISRCQRFDFRRISPEVIVERLTQVANKEGWTIDGQALWQLAEAADGGLRDALGLMEQTAAYGGGVINDDHISAIVGGVGSEELLHFMQALVAQDMLSVIEQLGSWYQAGKDASRIVYDVLRMIRDVFVLKLSKSATTVNGRPLREEHRQLAGECSTAWLLNAMKKLGEMYTGLRYVNQPRIALEAVCLGLASYVPIPDAAPVALVSVGAPIVQKSRIVNEPGQESVSAPSQPVIHEEQKPAKSKRLAKTTAARKKQVLTDLQSSQDSDILSLVQTSWQQILQCVKGYRIQTHAWLMNGEPVLATKQAVVVCFQSRIHRDAIMKPDERQAVEKSFAEILGQPLTILALLKVDWEDFLHAGASPDKEETNDLSSVGLAERARQVFGNERVEIRPEE